MSQRLYRHYDHYMGAALLRRRLFRLFIGVFARRRSLSVRFARGQRPGQRPPASFGRPARPESRCPDASVVPFAPLDIRAAFWYDALGREEMPLRWPRGRPPVRSRGSTMSSARSGVCRNATRRRPSGRCRLRARAGRARRWRRDAAPPRERRRRPYGVVIDLIHVAEYVCRRCLCSIATGVIEGACGTWPRP